MREPLIAGEITNKTANNILPFSNTLVNLSMTGSQVVAVLEDAVQNASFGVNGENRRPVRIHMPMVYVGIYNSISQEAVESKSVEVRDRKTGTWSPIDMNRPIYHGYQRLYRKWQRWLCNVGRGVKRPSKVEGKLLYTQSLIGISNW